MRSVAVTRRAARNRNVTHPAWTSLEWCDCFICGHIAKFLFRTAVLTMRLTGTGDYTRRLIRDVMIVRGGTWAWTIGRQCRRRVHTTDSVRMLYVQTLMIGISWVIVSDRFSGHEEQSGDRVCMCGRKFTLKRNDLWPRYLARCSSWPYLR